MANDVPDSGRRLSEDHYVGRVVLTVLVAGALVVFALALWQLLPVLLLVFGAVLFATILHALADPLVAHARLSQRVALVVAALTLLLFLGAAGWLFHSQVNTQLSNALSAARDALPTLGEQLGMPGLESQLTDAGKRLMSGEGVLGRVTSWGMTLIEALANLFLVIFGGVYLAANPRLYRDGVVKLFPEAARPQVGETLDAAGTALKLWLLGQLTSMVATGTLTWLALWALGVPSAAGLGLIAGIMELIPLVGPFLAAIPAILVALSQDTTLALWTAGAFLVVQQIESNLLQPLIMREAVLLPPALLLFAIVAFGLLFGILGVVFAAPLTVVFFVAVKKLYIRETLGERTKVPGEG